MDAVRGLEKEKKKRKWTRNDYTFDGSLMKIYSAESRRAASSIAAGSAGDV